MTMLTCSRCGQRYYGLRAPGSTCDFCHSALQEPDWHTHGRRAQMVPLPVVPLPVVAAPAPDPTGSDSLKPVTP